MTGLCDTWRCVQRWIYYEASGNFLTAGLKKTMMRYFEAIGTFGTNTLGRRDVCLSMRKFHGGDDIIEHHADALGHAPKV